MKRLSLFLSAAALLVLSACHKDLDVVQRDKLTASNMWQNSAQVEAAANAIYADLRANFVQDNISLLHWGELRVGSYLWGYSRVNKIYTSKEVLENTMTSSSASCRWTQLYAAIDAANAVIKHAPQVAMSEEKLAWALGQAYFARAYCYFWAARLWGGVPLNLNPVESASQAETYPVRASREQVYAQIGEDIRSAVQRADALGANKYLATRDAVNMLKAEYALWMYSTQDGGDGFLAQAQEALDAIGTEAGDSRLLSDYGAVFDGRGSGNKNSAEVVFALQNNQACQLTGGYSIYFTYASSAVKAEWQNAPVPIRSTQYLDYGDGFLAALRKSRDEQGDTRVATNLGEGPYGISGNTLTWPNKYVGSLSTGTMIADADIIYYRYAFAVMMRAELCYFQGKYEDALKYLNIIAKRAYKKDAFYSVATRPAVLQALTDEYFLEFPAEGVIWWALIRLGKIWDYNESLRSRKDATNILLWPIHKDARNKNSKLTQTEGWY